MGTKSRYLLVYADWGGPEVVTEIDALSELEAAVMEGLEQDDARTPENFKLYERIETFSAKQKVQVSV